MPLSLRLVPTLRSARSSWLEARVSYCRLQPAAASHTRRQHPRTRSRTHPQHARTHRHRKRSIGRCVFSPSCTAPRAAPTTLRSRGTPGDFPFLLQGSHPFLGRPFFLSTCFALRCSPRPPACTHGRSFLLPAARCAARHAASFRNFAAPARTDDRRTNDATCGPQAWLTGKLHDGGIRSVRSPLRRPPLLATPIATPLQCGRPERPGLLVP